MNDTRPAVVGGGPYATPDPTLLTTAQIQREAAYVREILTARLDALERAFTVFADDLKRVPTDVDKAFGQLKELHEARLDSNNAMFQARFDNINAMFQERTQLRSAHFAAANATIDAHLAAAKEANKKSEDNTARAIEDLKQLFSKSIASSDEKIGDMKDRLGTSTAAIETRIAGIEGRNSGMGTFLGVGLSVVMLIIALGSLIIAFNRANPNVASNAELVPRGSIAAQTVPASPTNGNHR